MEHAPKDEHHGAAVPKACYDHSEEIVEIRAPSSATATSQRYVEIVAKPCRQGDVPPVPKFGYVGGLIWEIEVLP